MVDAFIERIETVNRGLKAVVTLVEERASREAEESDRRLSGKGEIRPLEGIPVTIKDSIITEGVRSTWGMKMFEHHVARQDAPTVERLRAAGAIVIAKTNTPEMTMDYDCDNPVFGPTNNPWNRERVPGGSSGGEAAALAVGMSPLGMGSDFRGSIRVPAALLRRGRAQAVVGDDSGQRAYGAGHRVAAADRAHGDDWADGALRGRSHARVQCREGAASERAVHRADRGGASGEGGSENSSMRDLHRRLRSSSRVRDSRGDRAGGTRVAEDGDRGRGGEAADRRRRPPMVGVQRRGRQSTDGGSVR